MITLATLSSATAQQVFDQVATHLLTQKKAAKTPSGVCRYLTADGLKCAAGCLIADNEYDEDMEGMPWKNLVAVGVVNGLHADLINALQVVHDTDLLGRWKEALEDIAADYDLSTKVLEQF